MVLRTEGHWFVEKDGTKVLLRGINLGGSSKVPIGGETHKPANFTSDVTFVGRPMPLDQTPEHLERLKHWGFNCLRLLTTWEAVEHRGSQQYDNDYLDYFEKLVELIGEFGFYVFVDPHQDVWSRATGGDGAPHWIFDKLEMDISLFDKAEVALTMQNNYPHNYPPMSWTSNYNRFATATMFTLFFGGRQFAPNLELEGMNIQDYLQEHFTASMEQIAGRILQFDHVIGFGTMNEPHNGYIGYGNINDLPEIPIPGKVFSPFQAMQAAAGIPVNVKHYGVKWFGLRPLRTVVLNPNGISIWKDKEADIWRNEKVWTLKNGTATALKPHHFAVDNFHFFRDFVRPFAIQYAERLRNIRPDTLVFLEGNPTEPEIRWNREDPKGVVNASHWYDTLTLFTRTYRPWINVDLERRKIVLFHRNIKKVFLRQLGQRLQDSMTVHDGVPTLVGEFGVPFNLDNGKSFRTGNFSKQERALTFYYDLMDELMLHTTLWNYTPDNSNQWGDQWNLEDLSVFSLDQKTNSGNINTGGRAIKGFCRPYPRRFKGELIRFQFSKGVFSLQMDMKEQGYVEIFVPSIHFSNPRIEHNAEALERLDAQAIRISGTGKVNVRVSTH